jgi:exopolyphosphatase/guanosine-5'-triphosphate,3'-diphosphate pyrophosphatase
MELRAAVDLGTNSALLLVARVDGDGTLLVVEDHCMTPRLGDGLWRTGTLDEAAVERTLEVLHHFADRLQRQGVAQGRQRVVATAVLRKARDAREFVARVKESCGLDLEILSEGEEARLEFEAVTGEGGAPPACVVDVGGGSMEMVDRGGERRWSGPLGAVVLTERFLGLSGREPLEGGGWEALMKEVTAILATCPVTGAPAGTDADQAATEPGPVVALGGTPGNLACLAAGMEVFDHRIAEGREINAADALAWADRLGGMGLEERMDFPIEPGRAEILPAGLVCLGLALQHLGVEGARASGRGLRYGLVRSLAP